MLVTHKQECSNQISLVMNAMKWNENLFPNKDTLQCYADNIILVGN